MILKIKSLRENIKCLISFTALVRPLAYAPSTNADNTNCVLRRLICRSRAHQPGQPLAGVMDFGLAGAFVRPPLASILLV
jgi:hypothetical protein